MPYLPRHLLQLKRKVLPLKIYSCRCSCATTTTNSIAKFCIQASVLSFSRTNTTSSTTNECSVIRRSTTTTSSSNDASICCIPRTSSTATYIHCNNLLLAPPMSPTGDAGSPTKKGLTLQEQLALKAQQRLERGI
jgi:hypothetical protein